MRSVVKQVAGMQCRRARREVGAAGEAARSSRCRVVKARRDRRVQGRCAACRESVKSVLLRGLPPSP